MKNTLVTVEIKHLNSCRRNEGEKEKGVERDGEKKGETRNSFPALPFFLVFLPSFFFPPWNRVTSRTLVDPPGNENLRSNAAARLPATQPSPFACLTTLYLPGIDGIDAHPAARSYSATLLHASDFPVHVASRQPCRDLPRDPF